MSSHRNFFPINLKFICVFCKILKYIITSIHLSRITHVWGWHIINVCNHTSTLFSKFSAKKNILISPSFYKSTTMDINKQRSFFIIRAILIHMYQCFTNRRINFKIPFFFYLKQI